MTIPPDLEARLANVQAAFASAPSVFDPNPPDDDYQTLVHEFDFFPGGDPVRYFMKIRFQVQHHPEHAGRFIEKVYSIEEEDGIGYLKADLHRLGVNVEGMDIARAISSGDLQTEILDVPVLMRVKRPPGRKNKRGEQVVNAYIQQRLGDPQRAQRPEGPATFRPRSDVPEPAADEFVHPRMDGTTDDTTAIQASLDDVPFTGSEETPPGNENQKAALIEQGCECDDPVAVELSKQKGLPGTGSIECPLPGHAAF